jgi:uncharacterized protein
MATQNCIIIHGCPSAPSDMTFDQHWIPWIAGVLNASGIPTTIPLMPEPWKPDYEKYKKEFEKQEINDNTILIGHSCGSAFLVRWLGDSKRKVNKLILVAPWKIAGEKSLKKSFYEYPIDETIKSRVGKIVMFTADNEEDMGKMSLKIFHDALGGKIINLKSHGHYTMEDMKTEEFPELLNEVVN